MQGSDVASFFRNKYVRIILIFDVLLIILMIVLAINNARRTATITFNIAPVDAKVSLNGQDSYSNGSYQIIPGDYTIEISHDDLDTKTFNVTLDNGDNTSITTYLTKEGAIDYYKQKDNRSSFNKMISMFSNRKNTTTDQDTSAEEEADRLETDYLALQSLPINDSQYEQTDTGRKLVRDITIRVSNNDDCSTWLCIEALMLYTDDTNMVTQLMKDNGLIVEDYEVKYKTY